MGISVNPGATASRLGPQKRYNVIINGYETTVSLTVDQALERGLIPAEPVTSFEPALAPELLAEPAPELLAEPAPEPEATKALPLPANKARRPSTKSAGGTDDGTGSASAAGI